MKQATRGEAAWDLQEVQTRKTQIHRLDTLKDTETTDDVTCTTPARHTAMAHNKNGCTFSKGASCSCAFDTRGPWTVTLDLKNGTATPYMEGANGRCQRALLFLHLDALQFALRGFVLIGLFSKHMTLLSTATFSKLLR